jgi:hypothetical protein
MNTRYQTPTHFLPRLGELEALFCLLDDPAKVVDHPRLSRAEKRALLASWASDVYAVENHPTLRRLDNGTVIPVERILSALKALDKTPEAVEEFSARVLPWRSSSRRGAGWRRSGRFFGPDGDNDPPPCPAAVPPRPRAPGGVGATASVELARA